MYRIYICITLVQSFDFNVNNQPMTNTVSLWRMLILGLGVLAINCISITDIFTYHIFMSLCGLNIVWREAAQSNSEPSILLCFETIQRNNHTYTNCLVQHILNATFPRTSTVLFMTVTCSDSIIRP